MDYGYVFLLFSLAAITSVSYLVIMLSLEIHKKPCNIDYNVFIINLFIIVFVTFGFTVCCYSILLYVKSDTMFSWLYAIKVYILFGAQ